MRNYRTYPPEDKDSSHLGTMLADSTKEVDYLSVVIFVFMLLDSGLPVEKLSLILDSVATLDPKEDTAVACNCLGRARLAVGLVNAFLLKDSYARGLEDM